MYSGWQRWRMCFTSSANKNKITKQNIPITLISQIAFFWPPSPFRDCAIKNINTVCASSLAEDDAWNLIKDSDTNPERFIMRSSLWLEKRKRSAHLLQRPTKAKDHPIVRRSFSAAGGSGLLCKLFCQVFATASDSGAIWKLKQCSRIVLGERRCLTS